LPLQFEVPQATWIGFGSSASIYYFVERKDYYDRYVILLTTETSVRIIGVSLGSVTAQLWRFRPELHRRLGAAEIFDVVVVLNALRTMKRRTDGPVQRRLADGFRRTVPGNTANCGRRSNGSVILQIA